MSKKKYKDLSNELIEKINQLNEAGLTQAKISEQLKVSKYNVFKTIHGFKIYDRGNVITLHHVSDAVYNELTIIAENKDLKIAELIKRNLKIICSSFPPEMKIKKPSN